MGETGEDGLQLHEDQEPYRPRREMECHSQHGARRTAACPYVGIVRNRQSRLVRGPSR